MTSQSDFDAQNHTTWLSVNLRKFETLEELRDALEKAPDQTIEVEGGSTDQDLYLPTIKNLVAEARRGLPFEQAQKNGLMNNLPSTEEHKNFATGVRRLYTATLETHESDDE